MATLSDDGFTEILIAGGCAAALVASWIIGTVLIFFPRHETEFYRRRLVANMPRARDETLPPELQLQSTIDSISMATTIPGQSPVDATKDDEQLQDNPFEEGSNKASEKEDSKVQQNQEKKSKPPVQKVEQQPEKPHSKKKGKPGAVEKKREKPAAEKKPAKATEKKDDEKKDGKKKGKEEKPKENDKKKK